MKNTSNLKGIYRIVGIIALVAVIGFSFAACGGDDDGGGQGVAPTITTASLPNGTVGTAYSQTLAATGDTPITWSVDSGTLPAGLIIAGSGAISGTPTTAGTATFTVKATNATGSNTKSLSITIAGSGGGGDDSPGIESLTLSGQVYRQEWTYTTNGLPQAVSYPESNDSFSLKSDSLSIGSGNIHNGQLSYTLGKPDASKIIYPISGIFMQYFGSITVTPSDTKCIGITELGINNNTNNYVYRESEYTKSTTGNETTWTRKIVRFFMYVDKTCTVNVKGVTIDNTTISTMNFSLKKGWNIVCCTEFETYNNTSGNTTKTGTTSISVGDDSSFKWVLIAK